MLTHVRLAVAERGGLTRGCDSGIFRECRQAAGERDGVLVRGHQRKVHAELAEELEGLLGCLRLAARKDVKHVCICVVAAVDTHVRADGAGQVDCRSNGYGVCAELDAIVGNRSAACEVRRPIGLIHESKLRRLREVRSACATATTARARATAAVSSTLVRIPARAVLGSPAVGAARNGHEKRKTSHEKSAHASSKLASRASSPQRGATTTLSRNIFADPRGGLVGAVLRGHRFVLGDEGNMAANSNGVFPNIDAHDRQ